jgi:hypothetical protein
VSERDEKLARCRAMLYGYDLGVPIPEPDHRFLLDLLAHHPRAAEEIGAGMASFSVRPLPRFPTTRGFWLTRVDGTETDWSFQLCLHGDPPHRTGVLRALRALVVGQVVEFKGFSLRAGARCALTGVPLDETCHVDHEPPFERLAEQFVAAHGGFGAFRLAPSLDGQSAPALADGALAHEWQTFHRLHAGLRVVTAVANLGRTRRGS